MEDLRPAALHSLLANSQRIEARLAVVEAIPTDEPKGMSERSRRPPAWIVDGDRKIAIGNPCLVRRVGSAPPEHGPNIQSLMYWGTVQRREAILAHPDNLHSVGQAVTHASLRHEQRPITSTGEVVMVAEPQPAGSDMAFFHQ